MRALKVLRSCRHPAFNCDDVISACMSASEETESNRLPATIVSRGCNAGTISFIVFFFGGWESSLHLQPPISHTLSLDC